MTYEHDGRSDLFLYEDDGEALLALIEELTGEPRQGVDIEDSWGNGDVVGADYDWNEIGVMVIGDRTSVAVSSASIGGVPVSTTEGIAVGSARDAVVAAEGFDVYDEDADGIAEAMGVGAVEVPGTKSLVRPGEVGVEYVAIRLEDDAVHEIQAPGSDFGDI